MLGPEDLCERIGAGLAETDGAWEGKARVRRFVCGEGPRRWTRHAVSAQYAESVGS